MLLDLSQTPMVSYHRTFARWRHFTRQLHSAKLIVLRETIYQLYRIQLSTLYINSFADQVPLDPTFFGIFVSSPLQFMSSPAFFYFDQNPSGFCFLVQIRAFFILNFNGITKFKD